MLTETGRVVAVESDSLWVQTIRQSTCGNCSARQGCGHGLLNQLGSRRDHYLRVLMVGGHGERRYQLDDQVRIAIPEQVIVRGSFMVYMMPLLLTLLGAAAASQLLAGGDWAAVCGALAGFGAGIFLLRRQEKIHRDDLQSQPRLLGLVSADPSASVLLQA